MASTYLSRTNSTGGNRQVFTFSAWIKRGTLGGMKIFDAGTSTSTDSGRFFIGFFGADTFAVVGGATTYRVTDQLFRDTSAWYHLVVGVDTTQSTADDRIKVYVNGSQVTSFSTNNAIALNQNTPCNESAKNHDIGRNQPNNSEYFDGYMAEINFIDGTQYAASDFGQTDSTGIWKPKGFSGSYGTNGAYLKMSNSNDLGADSSGNANNFTKSGNGRQMTDAPSNNFATFLPLGTNDAGQFSKGNLQVTTDSGASGTATSIAMKNGKWYAEFICTAKTSVNFGFGLVKASNFEGNSQPNEGNNDGYFFVNNGLVYYNNASNSESYGTTYSTGDIISMAFDADTLAFQLYINGSAQGNYTRIASENTAGEDDWIFAVGEGQGGATATFVANYGQNGTFLGTKTAQGNADGNGYGDFYYSVPTGYLALCTKNLATELSPTIDDGRDYFNPVLWTGNNGTQSVTGVGFQPDIFWTKVRSVADAHRLADSIRGGSNTIRPNTDGAAYGVNAITFDSDGFTTSGNEGYEFNSTGQTYVSWSWLVNGGTTSSNSDGSITSTVQVNTTSGVSIIQYTGTGSNATVGHGLGKVPDMVIAKVTSAASNDWGVQMNNALGFYNALRLNQTNAYGGANGAGWWNDTASTTTTVSLGTRTEVNASGQTYIMYCFNNVEGYSKMGTYKGNGISNGPFIYTDFRPAFTIIKKTSDTGVWFMYDTTRDIDNKVQHRLLVNDSQAENTGSGDDIDIVSNGIKVRSSASAINASGQTFMYMAFAENPFVTSGGLPVTAR